jgi:putative hemolysin
VLGIYGSVPEDGSTFELSTDMLDISIEAIKDHKIEKAIVSIRLPEEENPEEDQQQSEEQKNEES